MANDTKSPAVTHPRDTLDGRPRTAGGARVREVWDLRLRVSERELLLDLAGVRVEHEAEQLHWSDLDPQDSARILIALRDLVQLGNEASYALGYSRRNG